jgi:hypothetical protein
LEPGGDFPFYSFIIGKMFSRKMMFKRAEQMEVAWSKVGAIRRMHEDFPLEISQRLRMSPYCQQDLAPSDFHLFSPLKHHLSAEHFPDDEAVEREQPKQFYAASFQGHVKRWDKCLNVQGDYVGK